MCLVLYFLHIQQKCVLILKISLNYTGYFEITGLCADSLLLVPVKNGYDSASVSYQATTNSPVGITMFKLGL